MIKVSKTGLKLLLMLGIVLLLMCIFNTKVNAITDTEKETILNVIPSSMKLNIKEIQYENANDIIIANIETELKEAGISNVNVQCSMCDYLTYDDFYKADIYLSSNGQQIAQKEISLIYSNSKDKNSVDEQYIKNIQLESPKYYEVALSNVAKDGFDTLGMAKKYYQNKVNDNSITILTTAGAGDGSPLSSSTHGTVILIFKNDILYDLRHMGDELTVPVITVPSDVSNIEEYALNQLNNFFENNYNDGTKVTKLEKVGNTTFNNPDIYNAYYTTGDYDYVIVRKETKTEVVTDTDTATNIKLDTTADIVPSGTKIVVEKVTTGASYNVVVTALGNAVSKFELYDISLKNNNATIQPNGKVKVSIPVPSGYDTSKIIVFYVADNGTKTKYDTTVKDGYVIFETDHFSNYVVAEETTTTESSNTSETTSDTTSTEGTNTTNTTHKLDNTPKTGEETNFTSIVTVMISVLSAIGLAITKRV